MESRPKTLLNQVRDAIPMGWAPAKFRPFEPGRPGGQGGR